MDAGEKKEGGIDGSEGGKGEETVGVECDSGEKREEERNLTVGGCNDREKKREKRGNCRGY